MNPRERTTKKENKKTKTLKIRQTIGLRNFVSYVEKGQPLPIQFVIGVFTETILNYLIRVNMILIIIVLFIKLSQLEIGLFAHAMNSNRKNKLNKTKIKPNTWKGCDK